MAILTDSEQTPAHLEALQLSARTAGVEWLLSRHFAAQPCQRAILRYHSTDGPPPLWSASRLLVQPLTLMPEPSAPPPDVITGYKWELYNVQEDPTQFDDLRQPEEFTKSQLKAMLAEAAANTARLPR